MQNRLRSDVAIEGTKIVGKLIGKGFAFDSKGEKVDEKYIIEIDTSKVTLEDVAPYLKQIVVDPSKIK